MLSIMKVISKILFKRKGFLSINFVLPIALIIIVTAIESGNSSYNIEFIINMKSYLL